MTKKRWKKKGQAAPSTIQSDGDPTTRSIALFGDLVAVAAGKRWRVVDIRYCCLGYTATVGRVKLVALRTACASWLSLIFALQCL